MKIREIMSRDPVCCVLSDSAQAVAKILCDRNIGSVPVVASQASRKLSKADLALHDKAERVSKTVAEISKASQPSIAA
jgi:predicted transcriptional regulator